MLKVAVVHDDRELCERIENHIRTFERESGVAFGVDIYNSSLVYLSNGKSMFDLVVLGAENKGLDGFKTAARIRLRDTQVNIAFVADSPKEAIRGYEYEAMAYIIRPAEYSDIYDMLDRLLKRTGESRDRHVVIKTTKAYERINAHDILYVHKQHNYIIYNTVKGEYQERGSLELALEKLGEYGFIQCNSGCLVNLNAVRSVNGDSISVGDAILPISRSRRSEIKLAIKRVIK